MNTNGSSLNLQVRKKKRGLSDAFIIPLEIQIQIMAFGNTNGIPIHVKTIDINANSLNHFHA
nr:hypothetical protein [uncultured Anaerostipes sp.]